MVELKTRNKVTELFNTGSSKSAIARQLHIGRNKIRQILAEVGVTKQRESKVSGIKEIDNIESDGEILALKKELKKEQLRADIRKIKAESADIPMSLEELHKQFIWIRDEMLGLFDKKINCPKCGNSVMEYYEPPKSTEQLSICKACGFKVSLFGD